MTFGRTWSAYEARCEAQRLAFAPVAFQCVIAARRNGLLEALDQSPGSKIPDLASRCGLSEYAVRILLESSLSVGVVTQQGEGWSLGTVGHYVLKDPMTQVNFDFIQDVCWQGLADLEQSLVEGRPVGLRHLGPWESIYPALMELPEPARRSWFAFDHHYSDGVFNLVLPHILKDRPRTLLEIGANTGKGALRCLELDPKVKLTLVDLPSQVCVLEEVLAEPIRLGRVSCLGMDVRDPEAELPQGQEAIWMSQFLCCFSEAQAGSILSLARRALTPGGSLFVVDTFWDRQKYDIAAFGLVQTSPYFTCMANGVGKMHTGADILGFAEAAGLRLEEALDGLGQAHTLLRFKAAT